MKTLLLLSLLAASAAQAQDAPVVDDVTTVARQHFDAGRAHYDLGRFAEALVEFEKAYAAKQLPALLFNIGQCHFQEKRYSRAVFFYERYLELLPEASNRDTVAELLAEARRLESSAPAPVVAPVVAPPVVAPPPVVVVEEPPPDDPTWLIVGGVGVAVVVAAGGAVAWALWTAPPPPGSLGIVDRRLP